MNANGKVEGSPHIYEKVRFHAFKKYNARSKEEYQQRLNLLSTWQLAEEAARHGLKPISDRKRLIRQLVTDFQKAKTSFEAMTTEAAPAPTPDKEQKLKELFAWMP